MKLRDKVQDTVTLFEGTVTGILHTINSTDRVKVEPVGGDPTKETWFDVGRLRVVEEAVETK